MYAQVLSLYFCTCGYVLAQFGFSFANVLPDYLSRQSRSAALPDAATHGWTKRQVHSLVHDGHDGCPSDVDLMGVRRTSNSNRQTSDGHPTDFQQTSDERVRRTSNGRPSDSNGSTSVGRRSVRRPADVDPSDVRRTSVRREVYHQWINN